MELCRQTKHNGSFLCPDSQRPARETSYTFSHVPVRHSMLARKCCLQGGDHPSNSWSRLKIPPLNPMLPASSPTTPISHHLILKNGNYLAMHYIKLLRPPVVESARAERCLRLVLAVTTDLGDSFFSPKDPVDLLVVGAYTATKDGKEQLVPVVLTQRSPPKWKAGMRVLKLDLPLPPHPIKTIQIRPANRQLTALGTTDIYPATGQGLILAAFSDISMEKSAAVPSVCFRSLRLPTPDNQTLQVEEDMGDSIARHIWDSGIATVSLLADKLLGASATPIGKPMPALQQLLRQPRASPLNILEVGCGIGTLGIGMARLLALKKGPKQPAARILMTDLPEAGERARANIARQAEALSQASAPSLEFESLDWEDGQNGVFGEQVQGNAWDLVVVSDCTYNTDTLSPLVQTLSALHRHSTQQSVRPKVFLSTKSRHSSEREFWDLMAADGWSIQEEATLPLPHIDGGGNPIELYLFEKK
ncbi:putative methyltransferase-domain-containing protein [Triangularia setosa]|uniref:Methyltransferase-domain-containing protein n=1 Tax=Triangularia setosa TaxID=2587417 RepID=A0AAN7A246_9PEZI|nr:putative methyltransferase-domain-containing protein [Podospora setosa]